jgi:hypothetical protein
MYVGKFLSDDFLSSGQIVSMNRVDESRRRILSTNLVDESC